MRVLAATPEQRAFAAARVREQVRALVTESDATVALLLRDLEAARAAILARFQGGSDFDAARSRALVAVVDEELRALRMRLQTGMGTGFTRALERGDADTVLQLRAILGDETPLALSGVDSTLVEFARANSADLVGRLTEDLRSRLNTALRLGATGAATREDIERQIGAVVDAAGRPVGIFGTAAVQTERVLHTEVSRLYEGAKTLREKRIARDSPYEMQKRWIATLDARTRPEHRVMNGATIPVDEHFNFGAGPTWSRVSYEQAERAGGDLGTKITGPHDSVLSAADAVNCRCTRGLVRGPRKERP